MVYGYGTMINTSHHILWEGAYKIMVLEPKRAKTPIMHSTYIIVAEIGILTKLKRTKQTLT